MKKKEKKNINKEKISKLKKDNVKLKKEKNSDEQDSKSYQNMIFNIKDLCNKIHLQIKKQTNNNDLEDKKKINNDNRNKENIEKINKKKEEFEKMLDKLKIKANQNKNKTINDIISNIKSQMLSDNTTTSDAITKSK